jgi:CheY-like chemotaxis protein
MGDKKIKVLCVEDEIDIRENLVGILESEDFEVLQAEDGNKGLEVFLESHPDIIISDIMMPNSTGHDLLKAIRENHNISNNNVPFIFLSALGQKEDILKGINLEASDYMIKPVDFDLLIAKIREKTSNTRRTKEVEKKNLNNLKNQVANIVPQEMLQYIDLINQISGALKSEIYGPLPHQKYVEDLNKIYIHSLKLKTMISNFLSGDSISSQLDVADEIIQPMQFVQNFVSGLNEKFQSKIIINTQNTAELPHIKVNKQIMTEVIKKIVGCMFKIDDRIDINISIAHDPLNRIAIIFYLNQPIDEVSFKAQIDKSISTETLDKQGLLVEISLSNNNTNLVLLVPNYRVIVSYKS